MSQSAWCTNMEKLTAIVMRVVREARDVHTIYFLLDGGWRLEYEAGQYITVFIAGSTTPAGKAYSLSSAPHEKWMSITVKNIGEFSGYLCGLKTGDLFTISRAYGFFNPHTTRPLVALAAGVGISPILSVLKDEFNHDTTRFAHLFYSNKTPGTVAHKNALRGTTCAVTNYITAGKNIPTDMQRGRISLDECVHEGAFYMICGSVQFVRDMWQGLAMRGVQPGDITTETFFES